MPILPPTLVAKLDPLIRRLASSHDGEVIAVVRALERRLHAERFDLNDLAETLLGSRPRHWRGTRCANFALSTAGYCVRVSSNL